MKKKAAFLAVVAVWLTCGNKPIMAAVQCGAGGTSAIVQDNFDSVRQGWYCNVSPGDSEHVCIYDQASKCTNACAVCGGVFTSSNPCQWQRSPGQAPGDALASGKGCFASQYAEYYRISCNCAPAPSCAGLGESCLTNGDCCDYNYCNYNYGNTCQTDPSPILIDVMSNTVNYHLTSAAEGVVFDIDADGHPERVGWTQPGSEVGFLALDVNHNGTIDNGSELMGNAFIKRNKSRAANGFEALVDLDGGPEASDGQITAVDEMYQRLQLWFDKNHNGLTEPGELVWLADAGVRTVFTSYRETRRIDQFGNKYRFEGAAVIIDHGKDKSRKIFDVYPATNK